MKIDPKEMDTGAYFSKCGTYRYRLWRVWDREKPRILFIMLNPSTADAKKNDPTVERCQRRAMREGYGGVEVVNIFAYRSTDPLELYRKAKAGADIVGRPINDHVIRCAMLLCTTVVAAWGAHGKLMDRGQEVMDMATNNLIGLKAFGLTQSRAPRHPLYIRNDAPLIDISRLFGMLTKD